MIKSESIWKGINLPKLGCLGGETCWSN